MTATCNYTHDGVAAVTDHDERVADGIIVAPTVTVRTRRQMT